MKLLQFLYKRTKKEDRAICKRWGIQINSFNHVLGIIVLDGLLCYDSDRNFRSNKTFDEYKKQNRIEKKVVLFVNQHDNLNYLGDNQEKKNAALKKLFKMYDKDYDCCIMALQSANNVKFRRSKIFFIKLKNALYIEHQKRTIFVKNGIIECNTKFKDQVPPCID